MMTLTHGQVIRIKGFYRSSCRIRVGTQEGLIADRGRMPSLEHGLLAWTTQETAVLDGRDKSANFAEIDAAPEIENGQQVIIEGRTYRVKVNGQGFFDPVAFIPIKTPDWAELGPKLAQALRGVEGLLYEAQSDIPADMRAKRDVLAALEIVRASLPAA